MLKTDQPATLFIYALLGIFCAATALFLIPAGSIVGSPLFLIAISVQWTAMLLLWKKWPPTLSLLPVVAIAVAARFALLFFPPGDDIYRYIWEGVIQNHGFSPYELAPNSPHLAHLRFPLWELINHRELSTIYGPLAQLLFRFIALVDPSAIAFKAAFAVIDLALLWVLFAAARQQGVEKRHLILYALNPLPLLVSAGEGHLEVLPVFLVIAALLALDKKKWTLCWALAGCAVAAKPTFALFLPVFYTTPSRKGLWGLLVLPLLYVPYLVESNATFAAAVGNPAGALPGLGILTLFGTRFCHNGLLYTILDSLAGQAWALPLCAAIGAAGALIALLVTSHPWRTCRALALVFLLCSPTVHPWYFLILAPFAILYPSLPLLILSLTTLPMLFFFNPLATGWFWHNRTLLMTLEYGPVLAALAWEVVRGRRSSGKRFSAVDSMSVIVPTLNEEQRIGACLESILGQNGVKEILVADGGSSDETITLAGQHQLVTVIRAPRGRGKQIGAAVNVAQGDAIMIVHADSRLLPDTIPRTIKALNSDLSVSGGAVGARYDSSHIRFRLTELINNCRARLLGISFGDQAQFFRRETIGGDFPELMLMEDIELSMRLKERGATVFIPAGVRSSIRMWEKQGYLSNFTKVIFLSILYLIKRRLGVLSTDAQDFYRAYYGKKH